jgi:outer membrane receptor for ferrienterochelin and colicin
VNITQKKRQLASGISVFTIAASLTFATPAIAQVTSSIEGHAAPGSTVTATDVNTGQSNKATADTSGHYLIPGVPPSTYRVQSSGAAQVVVVPLGQTVSVDLTAATPAGAIVITASRAKDVKTPAVTTNVSQFQIENLPNGDRNFLNFAALAPGVTVTPPTLGGKARQVQAGALNSDFTNTFIDGLSIKNLVNHGGTWGQNLSSGNPFPASAVDQFNVETQNFKAEYEQAGSAVISTVTKTGGNEFHGEIFGEWQPKGLISENFDDRPGHVNNSTRPFRPKPDFSTKYYGGDLGGPIIKDKLTFFVDFEATNKTFGSNDINVFPGVDLSKLGPDEQTFIQNARSQFNGSFPATFKEKLYFGKLTYFATPDDTINLSAFIRHESNLQINGGITTTQASALDRNNEDRYELWWTHHGSNWLNELFIARDVGANGQIPNVGGSEFVVTGVPGQPTNRNPQLIQLGGTNFSQDDHQYQSLIKDNVTITDGPHTIKFGAKINFTKLQRLEANNVNGTFFFDVNSFTGVSSSVPFAATINTANVQPVTAKNTQIGLFAQDDWRPDDHWLVSYGLRWDYESNATNEHFVTPPDVAAELRAYPGWAAAGINPNDFISTGNNRKPFLGEFQPRLGVSYDVRGDRDLVFFGGLGRYYDRSLFIDSALETIKDKFESVATINTCAVAPSDPNCVNVLPTDPDALRKLGAQQGGEVHLLNNHTRIPYSDEVDLGVRKRFGKINTAISFSYIKSHNIFQELVGNRLPDGSYNDGVPEVLNYKGIPYSAGIFIFPVSAIFAAPLPGHGSIFIGNSDAKANYAAVYLTADKPYAREDGYGFSAALTVSSARSNDEKTTGEIGDPFNFDNVNIGEQGYGPVGGLERWRFVGTGTVGLPFDVLLSTVVTLSSGASYGGAVCNVPTNTAAGNICYITDFGIYRPHGIGYKNVDFNISKSFKAPWNPNHQFTVYFEALNAFDFVNRQFSMFTGGLQFFNGIGGPATPSHKPDRGVVVSQGRNFKIGARFTF